MNFFQKKAKKPLEKKLINQYLLKKKKSIPSSQICDNNIYNNYMTNYNQNTQNFGKTERIYQNRNDKYVPSYNLKSYGNIKQDNFQDLDMLKIKMSFDLINQKINDMENIIQSLNEPNFNIGSRKNEINKIYIRDRIKQNKDFLENRENNLHKMKYFGEIEPEQNIFSNHHNYSVQNIKNKVNHNSFINDTNFDRDLLYNNYQSLQKEKSKTLHKHKYSSSKNLNFININDENIYNDDNNTIDYNHKKSQYSLNNSHVTNQKKTITKRFILNKNFFNNINKIPTLKNYKNKKEIISNRVKKQHLNNILFDEKINDNNSYKIVNNRNNKKIVEYFGSFDEYFLSDNKNTFQENAETNNDNKNNKQNNKVIKVNVLHKKGKNQNANYNIYNIVKNDKIIQNNYYEMKNKDKKINNSNLIIENQNRISYFISNKKESNNNYLNVSHKEEIERDLSKNNFTINQLQKCSESNLFLPNDISRKIQNDSNYTNDNKNNNNINDEEQIRIKNDDADDKNKNNNKIIENNKYANIIIGKSKDDFYYDLYAEKIIDVNNINNSFDEKIILTRLKSKYKEKFDNKKLQTKKKKKAKLKNVKKVKFFENENRIIKINQNDIASKIEVFNNSGKRIYHQKFNINKYINKLNNKNLKIKSIYIDKKEEFIDNSEWDKLYDIINNIVKKSDKEQKEDKIIVNSGTKEKTRKFNIKNIESFKKNGKKNFIKNNKIKK